MHPKRSQWCGGCCALEERNRTARTISLCVAYLWIVQRSGVIFFVMSKGKHTRSTKDRKCSRHARPDDLENAAAGRPPARIRDCPPIGAGERRSAPLE